MDEEKSKKIGVSELNKHYYEAEVNYDLQVEGWLSIEVDSEALQSEVLSEDDLLVVHEKCGSVSGVLEAD